MGNKINYSNLNELTNFLDQCDSALLDDINKKSVNYPSDSIECWNSNKIKILNKDLLKSIRGSANVYAIFVSNDKHENEYLLKYIGQTNSKGARTRLTNHLIKKHRKTGAKLEKVVSEVKNGRKIKISWISLSPESLRHYVEEELIRKYKDKLDWNKKGK